MATVGIGLKGGLFDDDRARELLGQGLDRADLDGRRVLVITPDHTRSGPLPLIFRTLAELMLPRVKKLDFLIALGTHRPLSDDAILRLYGISAEERATRYAGISIHNHLWERPESFFLLGTIGADEVEELSGGLLRDQAPVALNRLIRDYDHLILLGPVFPHEVAGFSGGNKYLLPGIAGPEVINLTHWLGALITSYRIIGLIHTPVRALIERAAGMVDRPTLGISMVVEGPDGLSGLFVGPVAEAWQEAARHSAQAHVQWVERPYGLVISVMPEIYDDLWVGAKGMYKLEPVVEDGGEVIIYAPGIQEVSYTHGRLIDRIGYHVRDYFLKQWERFKHYPGGVLAHSTHLRGRGTFEAGVESPRIRVTLATGIPRERCQRLGLGFLDPGSLDLAAYRGREQEGILVVERAGEVLYRLAAEREEEIDAK